METHSKRHNAQHADRCNGGNQGPGGGRRGGQAGSQHRRFTKCCDRLALGRLNGHSGCVSELSRFTKVVLDFSQDVRSASADTSKRSVQVC